MLNYKSLKRICAVLALVAFMGTTAMTGTIEAATPPPAGQSQSQRPAGNNGNKPSMGQRPEQKPNNNRPQNNNKPQPNNNRPANRPNDRRPAPPSRNNNERRRAPERNRRYDDHESHSDTGNLVTGLLIGGILGAIIANNT